MDREEGGREREREKEKKEWECSVYIAVGCDHLSYFLIRIFVDLAFYSLWIHRKIR